MAVNEENMREYYSHVYPCEEVVQWLSYNLDSSTPGKASSYLSRREFCFTMIGDIFVRFLSFSNADDLRTDLAKRFPEKIDVGGIYDHKPDMKQATKITPQERELVFDIDMSDYDAVRSCCKGKKICQHCWNWMACAAKVLRTFLMEDFGFKYILPVFSGRRGIHLWVCDKRARKMSDEERAAIVGYASVIEGAMKTSLNFDLIVKQTPRIHPTLERVHQQFLQPMFEKTFLDDSFENPNYVGTVAAGRVVYEALIAILRQANKIDLLQKMGSFEPKEGEGLQWGRVVQVLPPGVVKCLHFVLLYPRLDEHVSTRKDHLLKLPFCVHPGTTSLCTPLLWGTIDSFDPLSDPPKLDALLMSRTIEPRWKKPLRDMISDMIVDPEEAEHGMP